MGALLFMFIVFFWNTEETRGPQYSILPEKKVSLDHFYFINQLDFDCLLVVTITFDDLKEVYLEQWPKIRVLLHPFVFPNRTLVQFCSLRCQITKIGIGTGSLIPWYLFCQEKIVLPQLYTRELLWNSAELATFSHATECGRTGMVYR